MKKIQINSGFAFSLPDYVIQAGILSVLIRLICVIRVPFSKTHESAVINPLIIAPVFTASKIFDSLLPCCNTDCSCDDTHISQPLIEEITKLTSSKNSLPVTGFIMMLILIPADWLL